MIFDSIERLDVYRDCVPYAEEVKEALLSKEWEKLPAGLYRTEKNQLLIQLQEVEIDPDHQFEVHRDFIDVHVVLRCDEYYDAARCVDTLPESYDEKNDFTFIDARPETRVKLTRGVFAISFPYEPHRPRISTDSERHLQKKIVVKIPYRRQ
ncbi:MAG: YhcH/YjgK/YiaL family protein [Spirochaetales bacterium]|nr:YhcH/YjgK/YiaL family protein [Spirochaetales bacterium]